MDPTVKSSSVRSLLVKVVLFCLFVLVFRLVYVVTVRCDAGAEFCFFPGRESLNIVGTGGINGNPALVRLPDGLGSSNTALRDLWTSREWRKAADFYSRVFQDLIADGYLTQSAKALSIGTPTGQEVFALKEIGVRDSIGVSKKSSRPLVVAANRARQLFDENTLDFIFTGGIDGARRVEEFAAEIGRALKPEGFLVVLTSSAGDLYSFNSLLNLFNCCKLIRSREINGPDSWVPNLREFILMKENHILGHLGQNPDGNAINKCSVPEHKHELVRKAEVLIAEEPLKPWITLKRNIKNVKYLPSMVDISFRARYVYIDVGARSYGSSIGSWFRKQYPKQNRTFEIYAIEADQAFHEEYSKKKGVNLLPYAAWTRNETLSFEINQDPWGKEGKGARGMGRIRPSRSSDSSSDVNSIVGFDFADWLKNTVSKKDFVVMKMDVEGTEFELIPRMFETGAICLIDELFLECHYSRWQKCCPGERSAKYQKTYDQCLELFSSLRERGVLVHQWW
ncbi:Methyltransferase FkbM [Cinnamomum micranthum f. kanehirae]|uniref:Methyltransferase FkbM n=1 Tax=Cinnamomum micranthum f. kanehirae TaxID=337451 RepID=A0A443NKB0_9MAGN|nr:Methyltransferase FkbM [Cinnamomum micranthum f. kanehirae]